MYEIKSEYTSLNSKGYILCDEKGKLFFLKRYTNDREGGRLRTEYESLEKLNRVKIKNIPLCVERYDELHSCIYSYLEGRKIKRADITSKIIQQYSNFIVQIQEARNTNSFVNAKESCFSIKEYFKSFEVRYEKLIKRTKDKKINKFLEEELMTEYSYQKEIYEKYVHAKKIDISKILKKRNIILSPSDFGFHNSKICENGKLLFFDFEYFGFDDPVKLVSDFYNQQRMFLPVKYRSDFYKKIREIVKNKDDFDKRLPIGYGVFGLKWCLILLNKNTEMQLLKSKRQLNKLKTEFRTKKFPFTFLYE